MDSAFEQKLIEALDALEGGRSPDDILRKYPPLAPELRAYLETAEQLAQLPMAPPPQAAEASRRAMLERAAQERVRAENQSAPPPLWRRFFYSVAAFAVLLLVVGGLLTPRAQEAVPGDLLYPLKRAGEEVRLVLALPAQKDALREAYEQERNREVYVMLRTGREGVAGYKGEIKALGSETWEVGNITVQLTEETLVQGEPHVGARVSAHCRIEDGQVIAESLTVLENGAPPTAPDE